MNETKIIAAINQLIDELTDWNPPMRMQSPRDDMIGRLWALRHYLEQP